MARPKGSTTRPQIRSFVGDDDIRELTDIAVKKAKSGDVIMMKFLLEQVYGKAPQSIDMGGELSLNVKFDESFKIAPKAKGDSRE